MVKAMPFLCILCAVFVQGIELPGPCPAAPPTHELSIEDLPDVYIQRGVTFATGRKSYLFENITPKNIANFLLSFIRDPQRNRTIIKLTHKLTEYASENVLETYGEDGNAIVSSSVTIQLPTSGVRTSTCHKNITERVRIWIDDFVIIIWSCVSDTTKYHDEAVLIMRLYRIENKNANSSEMIMVIAKSIARKYLADNLMDQIDWSHISQADSPDRKSKVKRIPIPCSINEDYSAIMIIFVIIWIIGLAIVLWGCSGQCNRMHKNQVLPYSVGN